MISCAILSFSWMIRPVFPLPVAEIVFAEVKGWTEVYPHAQHPQPSMFSDLCCKQQGALFKFPVQKQFVFCLPCETTFCSCSQNKEVVNRMKLQWLFLTPACFSLWAKLLFVWMCQRAGNIVSVPPFAVSEPLCLCELTLPVQERQKRTKHIHGGPDEAMFRDALSVETKWF